MLKNQPPPLKTPEQWLAKVAPEARHEGNLKLFLGYAPGVGKTYSMLAEGIRRHSRGEDVVIAVVQTHDRKGVVELAANLETIPLKKLEYKGTIFEEMDLEAILARHPQVALVDELAHTNIEGVRHQKRYEDVMALLAANIDVISTVNIQHIESIKPLVHSITGIEVRESIPDWVMERANEVVMVDLTPEALQNRMQRGDIYPMERVPRALTNFFRRGNLIALRELALRQVAESVDRTLESYMEQKDITQNWAVRERIAVCISANRKAQQLMARAARMAHAINADFYAVHVEADEALDDWALKTLQANIRFARDLGAEIFRIRGASVAEAVAEFVREKRVTHVIFGRSAVQGWRKYLYTSAVHRFLRDAPPVDVHIVTQENDE